MDSSSGSSSPPVTGASLFWLVGLLPPLLGLHIGLNPRGNTQSWRWLRYLGPVAVLSLVWVHVASHHVPEPYLDEIFHIPQAQRYGQGKYWEWDDKLTTPPGLYIFSLLLLLISGAKSKFEALTPFDLRATNAVALVILGYLALLCRHEISHLLTSATTSRSSLSSNSLHTALNVCLFPVLFFFSGLYYTDVISTAAVLASFLNSLRRMRRSSEGLGNGIASGVTTVVLGIVSLFMRQTNVFWIVVFMGGLEAIQAVKGLKPKPAAKGTDSDGTLVGDIKYFIWRSSVGDVHDAPLSEAWVEDWVLTAVSLLIAGLCNPFRVLGSLSPYIVVLASFTGFVLWNGGVVLGDKTNHVATIHLPQMLYIWPFFAFFSLPLLAPYLLAILDKAWCTVRSRPRQPTKNQSPPKTAPVPTRSLILAAHYILGTIILSLAIVHFNTIIHPFTLADNRHYMFYVFRYTIRRGPRIRHGLVGAYTLSRWLIWGVFSGTAGAARTSSTSPGAKLVVGRAGSTSVPTSTGIIFLLATCLALITAPLVEPRYFIIPWVMWRLLIPAWYVPGHQGTAATTPECGSSTVEIAQNCKGGTMKRILEYAQEHDIRLVLETVWFVLVNLATMTIFIVKPYQWKAEDGTLLDDGRLQRFLW